MLVFFMRVLAWGTQKVNHVSYIKYLVGMMALYAALFTVKCNVNVQDTVVNAPTNAVVIQNVPWGIGAILGNFSTLTYTLTNDMENAFSTPQSIDYTQAGMGFSLTSQEWATSSTVQSPSLYRNFDQYISNCVLPGVSTGNLSVNTVDNSTDLLTDWAAYTSGLGSNLITTWYSETGGVSAAADGGTTYPAGYTTSCGVETNWIDQAMSYYIQQDLGPQEAGMLNMTWTQYQILLGNVNAGIYGVSQSTLQYIKQATAANQFSTAMLDLAKMSGVNANGLAYGTAVAQQQQTSQFTMSGILAGRYMPVVYGLMYAIFTGASLLLLLLMLLPHPMQYIKMYLELLLWLTIWPALMAIYNFIVDLYMQQHASGYFNNYSGFLNGVAISNAHVVSNWVQSSLAWVGYLSWSIPMLSYAIVSGSAMAMTSMVGSMDSAVGSGVSSGVSQGLNANAGNTSFGNEHVDDVSGMNNTWNTSKDNMLSANKYDSKLKNNSGIAPAETGSIGKDGAAVTTYTDPFTGKTLFTTRNLPGSYSSESNAQSAQYSNAMGLNETLGGKGTGIVTAATDPQTSMQFGRGVTNSYQRDWQSQITSSDDAQNKWYSSMGGTEQTAFKSDSKLAALQATAGMTKTDAAKTEALDQKVKAFFQAQGGAGPLTVGGAYELAKSVGFSAKQAAEFSTKYGQDLGSSVASDTTLNTVREGGEGQAFTNSLSASNTAGARYTHALSNESRVGASALAAFFTGYDKKLLAKNPNLNRRQLNAANAAEDLYLRTPEGQKYGNSWVSKYAHTAGINKSDVNAVKTQGQVNKRAVKNSPLAAPINGITYSSVSKKIREKNALLKKAEKPPTPLKPSPSTKPLMSAINQDMFKYKPNKGTTGMTPQQKAAYNYLQKESTDKSNYNMGELIAPAVNTVIAASNLLNSGMDFISGSKRFGQTGYMNPKKPAVNLAKTMAAIKTLNGGVMPANIQEQLNKYTAKSNKVKSFNSLAQKRNNGINRAKTALLGSNGKKVIDENGDIKKSIKADAKKINQSSVLDAGNIDNTPAR